MTRKITTLLIAFAVLFSAIGASTVPVSAATASSYENLQCLSGSKAKEKVGDYYIWTEKSGKYSKIRTAKTLSATPKTVASVKSPKWIDSNVITNGYTIYYAVHNYDKYASATIYQTNVKKSYTKKLGTIRNFDYLAGYYDGRLYYCTGDHKEDGNNLYRMKVSTRAKILVKKGLIVEDSEGKNFVICIRDGVYYYNVSTGSMNEIPEAESYEISDGKIYARNNVETYDPEEDIDVDSGWVIKSFNYDGTGETELGAYGYNEWELEKFGDNGVFVYDTNGVLYKYNYSTGEFAEYVTKLGQVTGISVKSVNHNTISVSWNKVANAESYQVYRATSLKGTYKYVKSTTATTWENTGLTTGKAYYYKVRAVRPDVYGTFSLKAGARPALNKVSGVTAAPAEKSVSLTWEPVAGAKGYQVYRATSETGKYTKVKSTTATSWENTGLTTGKTYYYKVRAYKVVSKTTKYGAYCDVISCKTVKPVVVQPETGDQESVGIEAEMLQLINAERAAAGASPLKLYEPVNKTAQIKAEDLYKTGVFDHYSENLGYFYDQYKAAGIKYYYGGENIAYSSRHSAAGVMNLWMNSKGHRANILNKNYTHVGIGYYNGYWVQQFIGTEWN